MAVSISTTTQHAMMSVTTSVAETHPSWARSATAAQCWSLSLVTFWTDFNQSFLNDVTWLMFSASHSKCITPLLCDFHWLQVTERIRFHLYLL